MLPALDEALTRLEAIHPARDSMQRERLRR